MYRGFHGALWGSLGDLRFFDRTAWECQDLVQVEASEKPLLPWHGSAS